MRAYLVNLRAEHVSCSVKHKVRLNILGLSYDEIRLVCKNATENSLFGQEQTSHLVLKHEGLCLVLGLQRTISQRGRGAELFKRLGGRHRSCDFGIAQVVSTSDACQVLLLGAPPCRQTCRACCDGLEE